jgi:hypothetical protein
LDNLERKFAYKEISKQQLQPFVRAKLDECLAGRPDSISQLSQFLQQKNIYSVLRQNEQGRLYGITFVDNQNKVVFNGSDLGKRYSAAALQSKPGIAAANSEINFTNAPNFSKSPTMQLKRPDHGHTQSIIGGKKNDRIRELLLPQKEPFNAMPYGGKKKKKKKKRKQDA